MGKLLYTLCSNCKHSSNIYQITCTQCNRVCVLPLNWDAFWVLGLTYEFDINTQQVTKLYYNLQRQAHPDMYLKSKISVAKSSGSIEPLLSTNMQLFEGSAIDEPSIEEHSSLINLAYTSILQRKYRAQTLYNLYYVLPAADAAALLAIFELNEQNTNISNLLDDLYLKFKTIYSQMKITDQTQALQEFKHELTQVMHQIIYLDKA